MSPPGMATTAEPTGVAGKDADSKAASDDAPLIAHDYDGIREYDNPLPGWWSPAPSLMYAKWPPAQWWPWRRRG